MYAVISRENIQLSAGTVVCMPGTWQDYCALCQGRGDSSIPRIKYRNGEILLMSPLPKHGRQAHLLARVVEVLLDNQNHNYEAFSPITIELPEAGGIEPDYCFYIDNWQTAVGKDWLNWGIDPPPDLVIQIDVISYTATSDYLPYGVPEVWLFKHNQLSIFALESGQYQAQATSRYFPGTDLKAIASQCLASSNEQGTGIAVRELRQRLIDES